MIPAAAIDNHDVAEYVNNLFIVFIIIIFVRILISWFPRRPDNPVLNGIVSFTEQIADPYLNIFRSFIKPIGMFDISPIIAVFVLLIAQAVIVGAIDSA